MLYKKHIFICTRCNKDNEENPLGETLFNQIKSKINKKDLKEKGYRLSPSGCMGLCSKGINTVIYPAGNFFQNLKADQDSIDLILKELE
mgnify:CR=1 FL=1|jgi:predicted metal-binding protein